MNPCRLLRDPMRLINSTAEFNEVLETFLAWRHQYDHDLAAGKIAPILEEAA